jgi:uncharacterized membrane protein
MIKRFAGPFLLALVLGAAAHAAIVFYAPSIIMDRAYKMIGQRGTPVHGFQLGPQMRPDTQSVVRPSPDLAYSGCRYDLALAPDGVRVRMAAFDGYSSLSFFDAQTNNFLTLRGDGAVREVVLTRENSPSERGIILIRRLAPTDADYARVEQIAVNDECKAL